jgi:hypothetical protein
MAQRKIPKTDMPAAERIQILATLQVRFNKHMHRHKGIAWRDVETRLGLKPDACRILAEMERTGGEPDVAGMEKGEFLFMDCAPESPSGRRSLCYDRAAWDARKEAKPSGNVIEMAEAMGISLLTEAEYRHLQSLGPFDQKTSSWLLTPDPIRALGGAIFGDYRYGQVFVYHNGVQSYYAARGFRGLLRV